MRRRDRSTKQRFGRTVTALGVATALTVAPLSSLHAYLLDDPSDAFRAVGEIQAGVDDLIDPENPCPCDLREFLKLLRQLYRQRKELNDEIDRLTQKLLDEQQRLVRQAYEEAKDKGSSVAATTAKAALDIFLDKTLDWLDHTLSIGSEALNEMGSLSRVGRFGRKYAARAAKKLGAKSGQLGKGALEVWDATHASAQELRKNTHLHPAADLLERLGAAKAASMQLKQLERELFRKLMKNPACRARLKKLCPKFENNLGNPIKDRIRWAINTNPNAVRSFGGQRDIEEAYKAGGYWDKGISLAAYKKHIVPKWRMMKEYDMEGEAFQSVSNGLWSAAYRTMKQCHPCSLLRVLKNLSDLETLLEQRAAEFKKVYSSQLKTSAAMSRLRAKMWGMNQQGVTDHPAYVMAATALSLTSTLSGVGFAMTVIASAEKITKAVGDYIYKTPVDEELKVFGAEAEEWAKHLNYALRNMQVAQKNIDRTREALLNPDLIKNCIKDKDCPDETDVVCPPIITVPRESPDESDGGEEGPGAPVGPGETAPPGREPGPETTKKDCDKAMKEAEAAKRELERYSRKVDELYKKRVELNDKIRAAQSRVDELKELIRLNAKFMKEGYQVGGSRKTARAAQRRWTNERTQKMQELERLKIEEGVNDYRLNKYLRKRTDAARRWKQAEAAVKTACRGQKAAPKEALKAGEPSIPLKQESVGRMNHGPSGLGLPGDRPGGKGMKKTDAAAQVPAAGSAEHKPVFESEPVGRSETGPSQASRPDGGRVPGGDWEAFGRNLAHEDALIAPPDAPIGVADDRFPDDTQTVPDEPLAQLVEIRIDEPFDEPFEIDTQTVPDEPLAQLVEIRIDEPFEESIVVDDDVVVIPPSHRTSHEKAMEVAKGKIRDKDTGVPIPEGTIKWEPLVPGGVPQTAKKEPRTPPRGKPKPKDLPRGKPFKDGEAPAPKDLVPGWHRVIIKGVCHEKKEVIVCYDGKSIPALDIALPAKPVRAAACVKGRTRPRSIFEDVPGNSALDWAGRAVAGPRRDRVRKIRARAVAACNGGRGTLFEIQVALSPPAVADGSPVSLQCDAITPPDLGVPPDLGAPPDDLVYWEPDYPREGQAGPKTVETGGTSTPPTAWVEKATRIHQSYPDDPYYHSRGSWGQDYDDQWALKRVGITPDEDGLFPWEQEAEPRPVVVAVIDSGVDRFHPELAGRLWINEDEIPDNGVDDDKNGYVDDVHGWNFVDDSPDVTDHAGHGTIVSGIIAAATNNGEGITAVNPFAVIMPVKVLDFDIKGGSLDVARAIRYAADNGARVINLSLGGPDHSRTEEEAVRYALSKDIVIVVASGNEGVPVETFFPSGLPGVITVAATDFDDKRAGFSNWGRSIDIAAPGMDVLSLRAAGTDFLAMTREDYEPGLAVVGEDGLYYRATGSSFAAPFVTGAVSLIRSLHPKLKADDVKRMVLHAARDVDVEGRDQYTGYGLLDIQAAVKADPRFFIEADISGVRPIVEAGRRLIEVSGTADASAFDAAVVEIGHGETPGAWLRIASLKKPVKQARLAVIPVDHLGQEPVLMIKLTVRHKNGRARSALYRVRLK